MSSPFYSSSVPQPLSRPSPVSAFDIITAHPPQASTSTLQASRETTSASGSQPDSPYYCSPSTLPYSPRSITSANAPSNSRVSGNDSSGMQVTEGEPRMVKHETERRLRPFACGIDNCRRRYRSLKRLKRHYQHSGDHGAIGLQLLALGQHECLQHKTAAETCQTTRAHSATTSRSSRSPSKSVALQSRPSTTPEHPPASPPDPSDRVRKISTDDPQRVINHVTSVPSSLPQERVSTPQSYPSRIQPPSDKLHPTLSSWLKNIKKLDDLINRLQGLASFSPAEHRSQLLHKVAALRAKFRRQQGRFIEFLQLSEEYANKYLFDISTEIQHQRTVLDNLDERLKAAKKLHKEAVDLQMLYESRTVATMKDLRATGLSRPLPEDNALFSEVDLMLAEIGRSYEELNKFWLEEIRRVVDATELCRIDPRDFEHWINFYSSLKRTIKFWKNRPISGDAQTPHSNYTSSSIGIDLGAIVSSLSPTINSLEEALDRISSSASLQYSQLGRTFQEVYVAFAGNRDLCLSFLRNCVNYGEKMFTWRLASNTSPTSFRARALHDLQTWTTGLRSDATGVSAENAASAQGPPRRFKITYNKALILEQKTTSGLNTLLEIFLSLAAVADGPSEDVIPDMYKIEWAWKKVTDSVRAAQVTLTIEPAQRAASMRAGSRFMFRMKSLVCFPALSSRASVYHALAYGFEVSIVTFSYKFASLVKVSWPQCCWNANSILRAYDYSRCDLNSHTIDREPSINWLTRQCVNSTCKAQIPHGLLEAFVFPCSQIQWPQSCSLPLQPVCVCAPSCIILRCTRAHAPHPCVVTLAACDCAPLHCIHVPAPGTLCRHPRRLRPFPRPPPMPPLLRAAVTSLVFARCICAPRPWPLRQCRRRQSPPSLRAAPVPPLHCSALLSLALAPRPASAHVPTLPFPPLPQTQTEVFVICTFCIVYVLH